MTVTTRAMSSFWQNIRNYLLAGQSTHRNGGRTWIVNSAAFSTQNTIGLISILMIVMAADVRGKLHDLVKHENTFIANFRIVNHNGMQ